MIDLVGNIPTERAEMFEGSMKGSGIDSEDFEMEVTCSKCGHKFEALVVSDDWGIINNDLDCEKCGEEFTFYLDGREPARETIEEAVDAAYQHGKLFD